jgi:deoxyribodipyrimidine photo-lyase
MPSSAASSPIRTIAPSPGTRVRPASKRKAPAPELGRDAPGSAEPVIEFAPSREAALRRMQAIDPQAYARTRKHLSGAASKLSPYVTHGITDIPEIALYLRAHKGVVLHDRIMFELAWREYFQHVWSRSGDAIFVPNKPPPARSYAQSMPADVLEARTGVSVIDASVRALYRNGYLHNHARLWLASYLVHLRKVDWRPAAQWMYAHLLDGDVASNWLSWQWVAGTLTGRPYVFTAENVRRHASEFCVDGSAVDRGFEELQLIAGSAVALGPERDVTALPTSAPPVFSTPPPDLLPAQSRATLRDQRVALVHPWSLRDKPNAEVSVGIILTTFHQRFAWSRKRWQFVLQRMQELCDVIWVADAKQISSKLSNAAHISAHATLNPAYRELIERLAQEITPAPRLFINPERVCHSFGHFWKQICAHPPFELDARDAAIATAGACADQHCADAGDSSKIVETGHSKPSSI